MKIELMEKIIRPHREMGAIGGIGFGFMILAPMLAGAYFDIEWLMWAGTGLFVLIISYIIVSMVTEK